MLTSLTIEKFIDELASASPAPGGGSTAALVGSLGLALSSMVYRLTIGRKKYASVEGEFSEQLQKIEKIRPELMTLIDQDTEAFNSLMKAFALPKETDEQKEFRLKSIEACTKQATLIPLRVMEICDHGIEYAKQVAGKGNSNALSDAGVSALMLSSACQGAYYNVKINLSGIQDSGFKEDITKRADFILRKSRQMAEQIQAIVESRF